MNTSPSHEHGDTAAASIKMALAWLGTILGAVTLQDLVMLATLGYTLLQTFFLLRDRAKKAREEERGPTKRQRGKATVGVTAGIGAVAIALAAPLVMKWEGLRTSPYLDPVKIPTVCYGETHVDMRSYTPAECEAMLQRSLKDHGDELAKCLPADLDDHMKAAALSFAYNVGVQKVCRSTFARKLRERDPTACAELPRWVYGGGQVMNGLVGRRGDEQALCLAGGK